VSFSIKGARS